MKNLVKISLFALALGFFASCGEKTESTESTTPAATETPAPAATETPAPEATAPAATDSNAAATAPAAAPAADTTKAAH
jgi:hypothetical protein